MAGPAPRPDLERAAAQDYTFIWRCLRRFGVRPDDAVDDAIQRVFETAVRRRAVITPGHERAFLFKTALLIATEERRKARGRSWLDEDLAETADEAPNAHELLESAQRRRVLDEVLESLPPPLHRVFVLIELDGSSIAEAADLLAIPPGTVASRLRRAREAFQAAARRIRARYRPPRASTAVV